MNLTTITNLPSPVQQTFNMKLLAVPTPNMIFGLAAMRFSHPRHGGNIHRFRRYNPLETAMIPLGPTGQEVPGQNATAVDIDAKIEIYGTYVKANEQITLQNTDPFLNEMAKRLGVSLRQTEDQLIRDMLQSTSSVINCVGGVNSDNPTDISLSDVQDVIRALVNNDARTITDGIEAENRFGSAPVRSAFLMLSNANMLKELERISNFIPKWNYPNQNKTHDSEWGAINNVRCFLSSIGSVSPNASANNADVYNNFVVGLESYGCIKQEGMMPTFIYRPAIFSDPLAQNFTLGYKFGQATRILNDEWLFNLRATLRSS